MAFDFVIADQVLNRPLSESVSGKVKVGYGITSEEKGFMEDGSVRTSLWRGLVADARHYCVVRYLRLRRSAGAAVRYLLRAG
jgi:hypothetical protein